jgi:Putative phage tail protein
MGGKSSSNSTGIAKYTGLQVQTSAQGVVVPIVWGNTRISFNLFWWSDFVATAVKQGKGGKGGGGKGTTTYTYKTAVMLGLCEGPMTSVGTVYQDQSTTTLAKLGLTLFTGTATQNAWSFLTSEHPTQALAYRHTAFLADDDFALGFNPTLPNLGFEIFAYQIAPAAPGSDDVNPADVIDDFLSNPQYRLASCTIDPTSLAFYKTYCQAQGLFFSPALDDAEQVSEIIDRWAALTNTWIFWSGDALKFVPLGDSTITNNGVTYTPNLTIQYRLTAKDFLGPGKVAPTRADPADCPNRIKLEIKDRSNSFNMTTWTWEDQALIDQFGPVDSPVTTAHEFNDLNIAQLSAQLMGARASLNRAGYSFPLGLEFLLLEPGDLVSILDPASGVDTERPVRLTRMERDSTNIWTATAEQFLQGVGTAVPGNTNSSDGGGFDNLVDPGNVAPPIVFEPDASLTDGVAQLWCACSGGPDWGGCSILISFDNTTFVPIGTITAPAWQGVLRTALANHADPDTVNTLSVDLSSTDSIMDTSATHADADALRTLAMIVPIPVGSGLQNNGEMISYGNVVVSGAGPFDFDLTYLRRGLYGTTPALHSIGSHFSRFDLNAASGLGNTVFVYNLPTQYIGQILYFKFASINKFGNALQDVSTLTAYTYTPTGAGSGRGIHGAPLQPTGLSGAANANGVSLSWNANGTTDNVLDYQIWGATGTGTAFGSCSLVYSGNAIFANIANLTSSTPYTFYLVAVNSVASSPQSTALNLTTGSTGGLPSYRAVTAAASPITLLNSDANVDVNNTSGGDLIVLMPPAPTVGQRIVIMDAGNNAATHKIILKDNGNTTVFDEILQNGQTTAPRLWTGSAWRITA